MSELQEATKEFLIESHENLDQLDTDLVGLAQSAAPGEPLGRIFRALHTIKGSCSFLGFPHLEAVAHAGENLLGRLRDGKIPLTEATTAALLRVVDAIRVRLAQIEATGSDGAAGDTELIALLNRLAQDSTVSATIVARKGASAELSPAAQAVDFTLATSATPAADGENEPEPAPAIEVSSLYEASVRIDVDLLDKLMTIAGEIVLARNQILQYSQANGDPAFQNTCRQLNLITTELQEHVMKTRLQPIGNIWSRFPRLVRDTALACGKKVRLETHGSETELDKTLIEAIRDPLTHLVRNAIDHGIEPPARRRAVDKPEEGTVRLRAYHEGGQVNVEVSDDGAGLDPARITQRALDTGLITREQAGRMDRDALLGLIFLPGFSTAATVTTVSGRGVGLDVVKTNIEKSGGSVAIHSDIGRGTTVQIRIPLTLAILKVLVVTSAGDRYAIPQVSIVELVRVEGEKARRNIQRLHGVQVYRYRDRLLPLVALDQVLQVERSPAADDEAVNLVVLQAADQQFGLIVDGITDTQEIVVKPLWKHLKSLACFAGATVMGDGRVVLILDVFGLAQRSGAVGGRQGWALADSQVVPARPVRRANVLLVAGRAGDRFAVPLERVARLEEFPASRIERVAEQAVVQYRGQILPLLDVDAALGRTDRDFPKPTSYPVVVYDHGDRPIGLMVGRILDIVEHDGGIQGPASRRGVRHTTVIQGHVTELLDVEALLPSFPEV